MNKPSWYINPAVALLSVVTTLGLAIIALFMRPQLGDFATIVGWVGIVAAVGMGLWAIISAIRWQHVSYVRDDLA